MHVSKACEWNERGGEVLLCRRCCCKKNWPQNATVTAAIAANPAISPSPIGSSVL